LGLSSEFLLPVAHQIREKVLEFQKLAHQDRRSKGQITAEMDFLGKADGSYA